MDYAEIERQALDMVLTEQTATGGEGPAELYGSIRSWLNAARREIQRAHDFPEMKMLWPAEADLGTLFVLPAGERQIALPETFKSFASERADLWRMEDNAHVSLRLWPYEHIAGKYDLDDHGDPEVFHVVRDVAGQGTVLEVYPRPDVDVALRTSGFFYLPDIGPRTESSDPALGYQDFLSRLDPLLVRDYVMQQAYMALEMWDSAARMGQSAAGRANAIITDAVSRQLRPGQILTPSFRSGEIRGTARERQGYPFWR